MADLQMDQQKVCVQCTQSKPLTHFLRRSGGKRRGTCRACRQQKMAMACDAEINNQSGQPLALPCEASSITGVSSATLPVIDDGSEPPKRKRRRRRRKHQMHDQAATLSERSDGRRGYSLRPPPPFMTMTAADASALRATRGGFIRMRGKSDNGRRWYQEITLDLAVILVRERAAVIVKPHTIQRLYANKEFRRMILERDNYRCYYCGQHGDTIDHLLPRAKGGHTTPLNCVCACNACNQSKADQDLEVFVDRIT